MVKDTLNSIFDNLKERTTNPFLGTLIVVWLIKNWILVYSLFYFDSSLKLKDRLTYISDYFSNHSFIWNMVYVILITLAVLVLTYFLLSVARLVTDTQERIVVPLISKLTDKGSIVLKTEFVKLQEALISLEARLETERLLKVQAQEQRDTSDQKYLKLLSESKSDKNEDVDISTYRALSNDYKMKGYDDVIEGIFSDIENGHSIDKGYPAVQEFLDNDLVFLRGSDEDNKGFFTLTQEGELFKAYWERISQ